MPGDAGKVNGSAGRRGAVCGAHRDVAWKHKLTARWKHKLADTSAVASTNCRAAYFALARSRSSGNSQYPGAPPAA